MAGGAAVAEGQETAEEHTPPAAGCCTFTLRDLLDRDYTVDTSNKFYYRVSLYRNIYLFIGHCFPLKKSP